MNHIVIAEDINLRIFSLSYDAQLIEEGIARVALVYPFKKLLATNRYYFFLTPFSR